MTMPVAQTSRNILLVPHQPHRAIRVRALEMARYLANRGHRVHVLTWKPSQAAGLANLPAKLIEAVQGMTTPCRIETDDVVANLFWVTTPYLLAPNGLCQWFNEGALKKLLDDARFDVVINASAYLFPVPKTNIPYIYDVVDDHVSEDAGPHWHTTRLFTLNECAKANTVLSISHSLNAILEKEGVPTPVLVPNGVDYAACASVSPAQLDALKQRHGLKGDEFVLAYIGNHGAWSGLSFLLDVFKQLAGQVPNARLIVVGPGVEVDTHSKTNTDARVIFTGPVSPQEATAYFHLTRIGLLPFDCIPFTDHALPLKIFEYGAARKRVLSSPLKELQILKLPHVELLPLTVNTWVSALVNEARTSAAWNPAWDNAIRAYDWQTVLRPLAALVEGGKA